jgi:hypothetical protein
MYKVTKTRGNRFKKYAPRDIAVVLKGAMEHIEPPQSIWQRINKEITEKEEVSYRLKS